MKRWICLGLCLLCTLGVLYIDMLWTDLAGQSVFRLVMAANNRGRESLKQVVSTEVESGAFAIGKAQLEGGVDVTLYECLTYHPDALGIVMVSGSPLTAEQLTLQEPVAMLSVSAAIRLSPSLDCVGRIIELNGTPTRVTGIYRPYEPIGLFTRTAEMSTITPAGNSDVLRRVFVWIRAKQGDPFVFRSIKDKLTGLSQGVDLGAFQAANLGGMGQMNRQGVRLWMLVVLVLLCLRLLRCMDSARRRFRHEVHVAFEHWYSLKACAHLVWSFLWRVLPSLAVIVGLLSYLTHCAGRLLVSEARVPVKLLDVEAWLIKLNEATLAVNLSEEMPVFGYVLNAQMQWMGLVLGTLSIWLLWLGLRNKAGGGGLR